MGNELEEVTIENILMSCRRFVPLTVNTLDVSNKSKMVKMYVNKHRQTHTHTKTRQNNAHVRTLVHCMS